MESFLDFEQPVAELENKIKQLRFLDNDSGVDVAAEIQRLERRRRSLTRSIYRKLSPWQTAQVARHPKRPYSLDYIAGLSADFQELHGDRIYADDYAIVGGPGRIDGTPVMFIGHQKGRDTATRVRRNYGMARPEGYRKAQRLMRLAEKFGLPVVTLIDTPGAYPGIGAEERGQSEAIASSLNCMVGLKTPVISAIIGSSWLTKCSTSLWAAPTVIPTRWWEASERRSTNTWRASPASIFRSCSSAASNAC